MPTDFFQRQDLARRRTRMLLPLFAAAVAGTTIGVVIVAIILANGLNLWLTEWSERWVWTWWWPRLTAWTAGIVLLIMFFSAAEKARELRGGGGAAIAEYLGGRPARVSDEPLDTGGQSERALINIVEEMAIAAGIPAPRVFVLERERGINALAAGRGIEQAAIMVTRGALQHLSRDELQAVIGHEFSHILNGDTRLNSRMILVMYGIGGVGFLGEGMLNGLFMGEDEGEAPGAALLAHPIGWLVIVPPGALALIGGIGLGIARLLQANVNRQREYLADASAVQFTRNPGALAGALKKVGGLRRHGRLRTWHAGEVAHMCIVPPSLSLLETHPPLVDRVLRLDPGFDGAFPKIEYHDEEAHHRLTATQDRVRADFARRRKQFEASRRAKELFAVDVMNNVGLISLATVAAASELLGNLPGRLREEAHDSVGAQAILLGLVPADDAAARRQQIEAAGEVSISVAARTDALRQELADLQDEQRLPLLDLALPTVQALPEHARRQLLELLAAAVRADERLCLRELCFVKIIEHALLPAPRRRTRVHAIAAAAPQVGVLVAGLAESTDDPELAFSVAMNRLNLGRRTPPRQVPTASEFEAALDELSGAGPGVIRRLLDAAAICVASDGRISPQEHEKLRAVAAALHVPLPPLILSAEPVEA